MFTLINGSCPLTAVEWTNLETAYCKNGGKYHCIPNENGQLGQVCAQAIWIQPYACPIFNTKTQKMDARLCDSRQPDCQIYHDYRSNRAYEYPACFNNYITTKDSTTLSTTTDTGSTSAESVVGLPAWVVAIVILLLLVVIALVTTLAILRRRIKTRKDLHVQEEESMLLPQDDPEIQRYEEDNTFYADIEAVAEGWKKLIQYGVVILVGVTGAGKTKSGLELLSMVGKNNIDGRKYKSFILRNFDDFENIAASKSSPCILLDDCLERWNYSRVYPTIEDDVICLENVFYKYIQEKSALVVLTLNFNTWNRCSKFYERRKFFRKEHIIWLKSLSYHTKTELLKKFLKPTDSTENWRKYTLKEHGPNTTETKKPIDHVVTTQAIEKSKADVHQDTGIQTDQQEESKNEHEQRNPEGVEDICISRKGQRKKNKTNDSADTAEGQLPVNDKSKRENKYSRTKNSGNDRENGKDINKVDVNKKKPEVNAPEKIHVETHKSKTLPSNETVDASNPNNKNSQNTDKSVVDTSSSGEPTLPRQGGEHEPHSSGILSKAQTLFKENNENTNKDTSDVAKTADDHERGNKSRHKRPENDKDDEQIRYRVDEKMMQILAKEEWKQRFILPHKKESFYLGFPEACALYSRDDKILEKGEEFFKDPINCLSKRFSEWRDSNEIKEREKYVALVYMLMNGGYMDIRSIKGELLNVVKSFCKDGDIINEDAVKEGVANLLRSYCVEKSPGCFVFQHEVIEFTLLSEAVSKQPKKTFENCDLNVLKRYMITKKNEKPEGELKVPVDWNFFELLAHRFVMSAVSLENHRCMEDKRFERRYKTHQGTAV